MILPLTDDQLKTIKSIYPRSQSEIDQDIAIIRHWLDKQPHLPKTSKYIIEILFIYIIHGIFLSLSITILVNLLPFPTPLI